MLHFSKVPDSSHPVCYHESKMYHHGERFLYGKCVKGNILFNCELQDETIVLHGDRITMEDGVERVCDDGHMKLPQCK